MADLSLEWHDDFAPDATGDLALVDGDDEVRQRLERRLFTAVQGYVWHKDYGAGLPQKIGDVLGPAEIRSIVNSQISLEVSVAPSPPPQISIAKNVQGAVQIGIQYKDAITGRTVSFSITT